MGALCANNKTACDEYVNLPSCPSKYSGKYDPMCNMWKKIQACKHAKVNAKVKDLEACNCDPNWVMYQKHIMTTTTTTPDSLETSGASNLQFAHLITMIVAFALAQ